MWANRYWYNFLNPCVTASWYAGNLSITDTRKPCVIWYAWCPHKNWYIPALSSMREKSVCFFFFGVMDSDSKIELEIIGKLVRSFFWDQQRLRVSSPFLGPPSNTSQANRMEQRHIHINCYDCCFFLASLTKIYALHASGWISLVLLAMFFPEDRSMRLGF